MKRAQRDAALHALHDSAEANGGTPVYAAVARLTEVDRKTLRRWWTSGEPRPTTANHGAPASPAQPAASPITQDEARRRARELLTMSPDDYRVAIVADILEQRNQSESDTARSQLTIRLAALTAELRPPDDDEDDDDLLDHEGIVADILAQPREALRDAVLQSPWLWDDDEIRRAYEEA